MKFTTEIDLITNNDSLPDTLGNRVIRFTPQKVIHDSYTTNHSIKFVNNGYEEYCIQGRHEKLSKGETMLINCERSVSAESLGDSIAIFIEEELINEILVSLFDSSSGNYKIICKNHMQRVLRGDFNAIWAKIATNPDAVLTEEFFYETGAAYITSFITDADIRTNIKCKNGHTAFATKERLQKAKRFIFDHIESNITLEDVAEQAAMSKFNLIRRFKELYGFTPIRLHTWLRLNKAKELIRQRELSLTEIADQLNYPDLFTFSKQFKRLTGSPPSHF